MLQVGVRLWHPLLKGPRFKAESSTYSVAYEVARAALHTYISRLTRRGRVESWKNCTSLALTIFSVTTAHAKQARAKQKMRGGYKRQSLTTYIA